MTRLILLAAVVGLVSGFFFDYKMYDIWKDSYNGKDNRICELFSDTATFYVSSNPKTPKYSSNKEICNGLKQFRQRFTITNITVNSVKETEYSLQQKKRACAGGYSCFNYLGSYQVNGTIFQKPKNPKGKNRRIEFSQIVDAPTFDRGLLGTDMVIRSHWERLIEQVKYILMRVYNSCSIFNQAVKTAVLWLNGSETAHRGVWDRLWNQAAARFITDGGANHVLHRESLRKPDCVTGDMDSISQETLSQAKQAKVKLIETPDQDKTDFTKCLEIIIQSSEERKIQIEQIVVLGGLSGRFDHTLASLNTLCCALKWTQIPIFVIDGENLLFVLGEGSSRIEVDKSKITGKCGIVPFVQQRTAVSLKGFRWDLEEEEMKFGGLVSTSNEVASSSLLVKTTAPLIFTLQISPDTLG